jgi:anthranilate synthase component 2
MMNSTVVLDNYDSFTYNLVEYIRILTGTKPDVIRNDEAVVEDLDKYERILLSPGPGIPSEAGITLEVIRRYASRKSILGICLGHQAIAEVFGGTLINLESVLHGITGKTRVTDQDEYLFRDIGPGLTVGHYHSWVVDPHSLGEQLKITALSADGLVMGIRHALYDVHGLQFHPESVMTPEGLHIMANWLRVPNPSVNVIEQVSKNRI